MKNYLLRLLSWRLRIERERQIKKSRRSAWLILPRSTRATLLLKKVDKMSKRTHFFRNIKNCQFYCWK
uniref:Golgin B1 n=1 Tax=Myotis myotis TaxID=51298 RepID=A0A7J7ZWY1_MYOMY|nr:golgin B1 [Myotis myotis]